MARRFGTHLRRGLVVLSLSAAVGAVVLSLGFSFEWASRPLPYRQGQTTFPSPYHPEGHVVAVEVDGGRLSIIHTFPLERMPDITLPIGSWPEVVRSSELVLGPFAYNWAVVRCRVMPWEIDLLTRRVSWKQLRTLGVAFERREAVCPLYAVAILCCVYPAACFATGPLRRYRRRRRNLCQDCGYDLTGNVSGVCPECGEKVTLREAEPG